MSRQLLLLPALLLTSLACAGCVTKGTYQQKVGEAEILGRDLNALQQTYRDLSREQEDLKARLGRLNGENETLLKDKVALEEVLKAKSDTLSQKISELMADNDRLRHELAEIQKVKEEKVKEVSRTYEDLLEKMKGEIAQGQVTITELKGKLTVNMVEAILFDSGHAEVKPEGLKVLQKVVDILREVRDKSIRIEGHTDTVPIIGALTKRYPSNWELSAARAINVARFLQQQGIDPTLLSAAAFSQYRPVAGNDTQEGRARNRRIEIVLVTRE